jgi:hypothetical protein
VQRHHNCEEGQVRDPNHTVAPDRRGKKQIDRSHQPHDGGHRIQHHDLLLEERERRQLDVLVRPFHVREVNVRGEAVLNLPDQIRQSQREGDCHRDPEPFLAKQFSLVSRGQSNEERGHKEDGGMFVLDPEPNQYAEPDQQLWICAINDPQQHVDAAHPEERFQRVHRIAGGTADNDRCQHHRSAGEKRGKALTAKFPHEQAGEDDLRSIRKSRQDAQRMQRIPEQHSNAAQQP